MSSAATTDYAYLGLSNELVSELQNGVQKKSYTYAPTGQRLAQTIDNPDGTRTPGYYSYNSHSDVEAITGSDGNTQSTYGYTAYGQNVTSQFTGKDKSNAAPGATTQPFNAYRYEATRWDSSSGQYDMGFRNYSPGLNQFLTRDMYNGALADMSLDTDPFTGDRYTFGGGNPVSNIDLTGHRLCTASDITPDCDVVRGPMTAQTFAERGGQTANPDKTAPHNDAVRVSVGQIIAQGADPAKVPTECRSRMSTEERGRRISAISKITLSRSGN